MKVATKAAEAKAMKVAMKATKAMRAMKATTINNRKKFGCNDGFPRKGEPGYRAHLDRQNAQTRAKRMTFNQQKKSVAVKENAKGRAKLIAQGQAAAKAEYDKVLQREKHLSANTVGNLKRVLAEKKALEQKVLELEAKLVQRNPVREAQSEIQGGCYRNL